ncbi:MAG: hypothetical protein RJA61_197 [Candidatus Parcubacteria bacterium]|jgi:hypothetical protein
MSLVYIRISIAPWWNAMKTESRLAILHTAKTQADLSSLSEEQLSVLSTLKARELPQSILPTLLQFVPSKPVVM